MDHSLVEKIFFHYPLYKKISFLEKVEYKDYNAIKHPKNPLDAYCPICGKHTTFHDNSSHPVPVSSSVGHPVRLSVPKVFDVKLECARRNHLAMFYFRLEENFIQKIGQSPSFEDFVGHEFVKYKKLIDGQNYSELIKSGILFSSGLSVAAILYLRRVYESIISSAYHGYPGDLGTDYDKFKAMRMDAKIDLLSGVLPRSVIKNKSLYSIMSKSVHEINEEECSEYFPALRSMMLLILEQNYEIAEKMKIEKELESQLNSINSKLSKN